MSIFDGYSCYYDLLYRDKDYAAEADYVRKHIHAHVLEASRVLELGSGTGRHAECLASRGFTVLGVDLSETMLKRAETRRACLPSDLAEKLTFVHGDIRKFRRTVTFDAVVSLFHVMSYQTSNDDLEAVFATAAAHLRPGGIFIFDFWYGPAVLTQKPEVRVKRLEDECIRVTRIAEPELRANENMVDVSYHVWIEDKASGHVEQIRENHQMRYLFLPEVARLVRAHGFSSWDAEEWMTGRKPSVDTWGVCVRASR